MRCGRWRTDARLSLDTGASLLGLHPGACLHGLEQMLVLPSCNPPLCDLRERTLYLLTPWSRLRVKQRLVHRLGSCQINRAQSARSSCVRCTSSGAGAYDARSSFSFASMKSTSFGLVPGPPAKWPQIEGTGTRLAFGMCATSHWPP
jgi:hypothetical protein